MSSLKYAAIRSAFQLLSFSGLPRLLRRYSRCKGVIFTLHRVLPEDVGAFQPNSILQVKPQFLEEAIKQSRASGFEIVDLDEATRRISSDQPTQPFVVFTFDDAYRDNLVHALPILQRLKCPFTLYVPTAFVDGSGEVWWQALEDIIKSNDAIKVDGDGNSVMMDTSTNEKKNNVFNKIYWNMRAMPEPQRVELINSLARDNGLDIEAHCKELIMNWNELKTFADEPLCTIAAHTVHHYELAKLPEDDARKEIRDSTEVLTKKFGKKPKHFSFPIGSLRAAGPREHQLAAELGFETAVTTRPGGLYARHKDSLSALPRISLNGNFQEGHFLDVFLTGAIFSILPSSL